MVSITVQNLVGIGARSFDNVPFPTIDRRISMRGQIEAKKFCAAGSRPSRQGVDTILATKPNASSFPAIVLLLCNFTDEDKKPEIVVTLFGAVSYTHLTLPTKRIV